MKYKNFFFDLGNTLTVSADFAESFSEVKYPGVDSDRFKDVGTAFDRTLSSYYSKGADIQPLWEDVFSSTFRALDFDLDQKKVAELTYLLLDRYNEKCTVAPFAIEILDHLKEQNKKIVLVSNVTGPPKVFYKHLKRLGIDHYFHTIIWSSEVGYRKPSQEIFKIALSRSNSEIEDSIFKNNFNFILQTSIWLSNVDSFT